MCNMSSITQLRDWEFIGCRDARFTREVFFFTIMGQSCEWGRHVVWQTVLYLSSGELVPFSFLHASELVFFIQFTICLLTVPSKLTPT